MNQHSDFPRIGERPEQEAHSAPAIRLSLSDIVEECDLTYLHVFPYSEREGTPAAKIPDQVDSSVRKERAKRLRELGDTQLSEFSKKQVGKEVSVVVEKDSKARAENFVHMQLNKEIKSGSLIQAKILRFENKGLYAAPL